MSDTPQGEHWWQASDGRWYPPEQHPQAAPPGATPPIAPGAPTPGDDAPGATDKATSNKGKLAVAAVVVLALIAAGVAAVFLLGSDGDDDNVVTDTAPDIGDATQDLVDDGPIEFNTEYRAALEGQRTEARYTLDAPDGAMMTLLVSNEAASQRAVLATFESAGDRFASFRVQPGGEESELIILDAAGAAGFDLVFTEGPAEFTFQVALEVQDDAGQGGDAGDEFSTAFEIAAGSEVPGLLGGEDTTDHYTVELVPGSELSVSASVPRESERAVLVTLQLDGERLFNERVQPGASTSVQLLLADTDEGTLEVIAAEGAANYQFTVDFTTDPEGGADGDAPGDLANARAVDVTSPINGAVGGRDESDYFTFDAPSASFTVTGTAEAASERAYSITLEDASGSRVAFFRVQPGSSASETVEVPAGSPLRMILAEGPAEYSVSVG